MKTWSKFAVLALIPLSLNTPQATFANPKLPDRLRTTLTAPICIGNSVDGQEFALKIDNDDLPVEYDAKLLGHMRIVTPDSRATKNQFVELVIDKLSTKDKSIPVKADLQILTKTLRVNNHTKISIIPIREYNPSEKPLSDFISHCSGHYPVSERRKNERMARKAKAAMKVAAISNRRYGLERAGQMVFLSTKANPFDLPAGWPFRVVLPQEIEL